MAAHSSMAFSGEAISLSQFEFDIGRTCCQCFTKKVGLSYGTASRSSRSRLAIYMDGFWQGRRQLKLNEGSSVAEMQLSRLLFAARCRHSSV